MNTAQVARRCCERSFLFGVCSSPWPFSMFSYGSFQQAKAILASSPKEANSHRQYFLQLSKNKLSSLNVLSQPPSNWVSTASTSFSHLNCFLRIFLPIHSSFSLVCWFGEKNRRHIIQRFIQWPGNHGQITALLVSIHNSLVSSPLLISAFFPKCVSTSFLLLHLH